MSAPTCARASLVFEILGSPSAPSGGSGSFDIALADTDASGSTMVSNFQAEITVPAGSGVTFTSVSVATTSAPYIFGTEQNPPLTPSSFPNTDLGVGDNVFTASNSATLNPGDVVGLAHVLYSVAAGTPVGPVTISFVSAGTSLQDQNSNALPVTTSNKSISVTAPAAVPEPSPLVLGGIAAVLALAAGRLRRKR